MNENLRNIVLQILEDHPLNLKNLMLAIQSQGLAAKETDIREILNNMVYDGVIKPLPNSKKKEKGLVFAC